MIDPLPPAAPDNQLESLRAENDALRAEVERLRARLTEADRMRYLADALPHLVWTADAEGQVTFLNERWRGYTGMSVEASLNHGARAVLHPDDRDRIVREWEIVAARGEPYEGEARLRRHDGAYRWFLVRSVPIQDESGRIVSWFGTSTDIDEQKRTQQALAEAEQRQTILLAHLEALLDHAPIGFAFFDRENRYVRVNQTLAELNGRSIEEHLGHPLRDIVPANAPIVAPILEQVFQTGQAVQNREITGETPAAPGEARTWLTSFFPVLIDGETQYVGAVVVEITARKRAESQLAESRLLFQRITEASPDLLYVFDLASQQTVYANREFLHILGYTPAQLKEMDVETITSLIHPDDLALVAKDAERFATLADGEYTELEYRVRHADGSWRWLRRRAVIFSRTPDGEPQQLLGVAQDITEHKRAESVAIESQQRLQDILDASTAIIYVKDLEGHYTLVNKAWTDLFGTPVDDILGKSDFDYFPQEVAAAFVANDQRVLAKGAALEFEERALVDGAERIYISVKFPLRDPSGQPTAVCGISTDITERKQDEAALRAAKEAAEAANQAKSVFLANMSHEIRTPLTAMIGFASLLAKRTDGRNRTFAERIEQSGKRLTETLSAVLALAKLEAGQMAVAMEPVVVAEQVAEVVDLYRNEARHRGLALSLEVSGAARHTMAQLDVGALHSILQNLLSNAIKFTEAGRVTVTVEVDDARAEVCIHVTDTGIGIAPDFMPHLFETFRQESTGISRSYQGSGLGLSIARQLAEKMGGTIVAESRKGEGSRFTVRFPLVAESPPATVGPTVGTATPARYGHLLVVEDDDGSRLLVESVLSELEPYEVTSVRNAVDATDMVQQRLEAGQVFDLVLLDVNLGEGGSGLDVLHTLRALADYHSVPVIALTAYALPGDRERFLDLGFDAYLPKPFTVDDLLAIVHRLLSVPAE